MEPNFYHEPQAGVNYTTEVVTIFLRCNSKLLLLQRVDQKVAPLKWCIPGGKLEEGELPIEGLVRELNEELSWTPEQSEIVHLSQVYVHHPICNYCLHLYQCDVEATPEIQLNDEEHIDYAWIEESDLKSLDLIDGQYEAYKIAHGGFPHERKV